MLYEQLFAPHADHPVTAAIIGTGTYGLSLLAQAQLIPQLAIPVICDRDLDVARRACEHAGIPVEQIAACESRAALLRAIESGQTAITADSSLLMETPIDLIVECTGHADAAASHAESAIQHGKHVAMVTKETDSVIGPILKRMAERAGVVYTPVDGDQHGLLMQMIGWARCLGFEVISGGKARPHDFVYDETARTVTAGHHTVTLSADAMRALAPIQDQAAPIIAQRRDLLRDLPQIAEPDLCESAIMINTTGLTIDLPTARAPIVRITEIPAVLCPQADGGILNAPGRIEVLNCLRRADEPGLGGGVFIVFAKQNPHVWDFLKSKGLITNPRDTCGVLYRPYHLLGAETPISLLAASLLGQPTASRDFVQRVDLVARTARDVLTGDTVISPYLDPTSPFDALIYPSSPVSASAPLPYHLAAGNPVTRDLPAATILTGAMIAEPPDSRLWALRRQQDVELSGS